MKFTFMRYWMSCRSNDIPRYALTGIQDEKAYGPFFEVHETPKRGISVKIKEDAVREARQLHGFFALVSNEVKDPIDALSTYRGKDIVEKAFGNLKERLNCRRLLASSEESLNGKLFVEFVALIYLAYINRKMQEHGLYKDYTMEKLLLELFHPEHLRTGTGADSLRGPGEAAQPLCGIGRLAAAMTFLVMR